MKIAILGAGYVGLACAWHLLHASCRSKSVSVSVFDGNGLGGGASGIAAGLLHPYVGRHAKRNWKGVEGMQATRRLIEQASLACGHPVSRAEGLLRVALSEEQEKNYRQCAEENEDVEWWTERQCLQRIPSLASVRGGIYIPCAQAVYSDSYLQGLWRICEAKGAEFIRQSIHQLAQLKHFDRIIVAAGAGTPHVEETAGLPMTLIKGQLLRLAWPASMAPLPFSVNSQAYVVMDADKSSCVVGSTYERGFDSLEPQPSFAIQEILPLLNFIPQLQTAKILDCRAHLRVSTKGHLPMCRQVSPKVWALVGMGSKGLLYHALFAEELSHNVLNS